MGLKRPKRGHWSKRGGAKRGTLGLAGDRLAELARLAVELQQVTEEHHSRRALGVKAP